MLLLEVSVFLKTKYPVKPAITDANRILIFALLINSDSLNARLLIVSLNPALLIFVLAGITNAARTPAIVACTPES